ncbi:hypothetical protein BSK59_05895 [Paenibacillus odorifer]|nr:hypothetical protein BSK59_05895 [Paenibacillus odorifer]
MKTARFEWNSDGEVRKCVQKPDLAQIAASESDRNVSLRASVVHGKQKCGSKCEARKYTDKYMCGNSVGQV